MIHDFQNWTILRSQAAAEGPGRVSDTQHLADISPWPVSDWARSWEDESRPDPRQPRPLGRPHHWPGHRGPEPHLQIWSPRLRGQVTLGQLVISWWWWSLSEARVEPHVTCTVTYSRWIIAGVPVSNWSLINLDFYLSHILCLACVQISFKARILRLVTWT